MTITIRPLSVSARGEIGAAGSGACAGPCDGAGAASAAAGEAEHEQDAGQRAPHASMVRRRVRRPRQLPSVAVTVADRVKQDVVPAMKEGDKDRVQALRLVLSELQKDAKEGDGDETAVLRRERKRRQEAARAFREGGRDELATAEEAEAEIIGAYLPAELSDDELDSIVAAAIAETGAVEMKQMGVGDEGRDGEGRRPRRRLARERQGQGGAGMRRQIELSNEVAAALTGTNDQVLRALEEHLGCDVFLRGNVVTLDGDAEDVQNGATVVRELSELIEQGHEIAPGTISAVTGALDQHHSPAEILEDVVWRHRSSKVAPKTVNQKRYVDAIRNSTITFGIGPAGTGKTFLAVAMAAAALTRREVNRIILTRPAVEAGERLGFLPGDLMAKIDPYLRPLFDALHDMLDPEKVAAHLERNVIEVAPLAFMRGRTLNDSFVILDEAQNTTPEQMKMFLTRLGFGSKMVITGDITQVDLPRDQQSGLIVVADILKDVEGVDFVRFGGEDVVRHRLVQRIVEAYDEHASTLAPGLRPATSRAAVLDVEILGAPPGAPPEAEIERLVGIALASAQVEDGHVAVAFVDAGHDRLAERRAPRQERARPTSCRSRSTRPGRRAGPRELGDVVICPEHTDDLREAIVHGALHLAGMDHETDDGEMLALQAELLSW